MVNFVYNAPTKVVFGRGTEAETGRLAKEFGAKKVLVHYGSPRVKADGLLGIVGAALKNEGIDSVELGGVVPNPHLGLVREGIELCKAEKVDFILAVGGGSVIDSAKAIAYGVANPDVDVWDFYTGKEMPKAILPVGVVLTIAAAGSEMSNSSVITNEQTHEKRGLNNELGRCRFAVMDPALTTTLPEYPTACGVADILMHTLERYFTNEEPMEITMGIAEGLLRTVMQFGRILTRRPDDYAARAEIMWASSLSHNGLTGCGGGNGDWACHQMAHELSGRFDTAHGAALTAIWGSWARYVYKENPARFARLAIEVLEIEDEGSDEEIALAGIEEMESFFWAIDMPTTIEDLDLGVDDAIIAEMAAGCSRGGSRTVGAFKPLAEEDMKAIYTMANQPVEE